MLKKSLAVLIVFLASIGIFTTVAFAEEKKCNAKIVIIGAGIAGLGAANELNSEGCDVTVLEAKDKVGGRIDTDNKTWLGIAIDKHASWIHGIDGNPIMTFAEKFNLATVPSSYDCYGKNLNLITYDVNGTQVSEATFNDNAYPIYQEFTGFRLGMLYKILHGTYELNYTDKKSRENFENAFIKFNRGHLQPDSVKLFYNTAKNWTNQTWNNYTSSLNDVKPKECNSIEKKQYDKKWDLIYKFNGFIEGANYTFVLDKTKYTDYNQVSLQDSIEEFIKYKNNTANFSSENRTQFEYFINSYIGNEAAADASDLSFLHYDEIGFTVGNETIYEEVVLPNGYTQIIDELYHGIEDKVKTKQHVVKVQYDNQGVTVTTNSTGPVKYDYAIVTLPLGVLKKGSVEFDPPLPAWKTGAINHLGAGTLNKAYFSFDKAFWDNADWIDYISKDGSWTDFLNLNKTHNQPILLALNHGKYGKEMENISKENVTNTVFKILNAIYKNNATKPKNMIMTKAWSDEFVQGSYSYIPVGSDNTDYDKLAKPYGRLFFAGEATTKYYPGTTHGAYLTGLREVNRINYKILNDTLPSPHEQQIHTPTILKGMEESVKKWKVFPEYVMCKDGHELIAKWNSEDGFTAACVSHEHAKRLIDHGWAFSLNYSP